MRTTRNIKLAAFCALLLSSVSIYAQGEDKAKVIIKENETVKVDTIKEGGKTKIIIRKESSSVINDKNDKDIEVTVKDKKTGADKKIVIVKRVQVDESTDLDGVMKDLENGEKPGTPEQRKEIIIIDAGALEEAGEDIADKIEDKVDQLTDKIEETMKDVEVRVERAKGKKIVIKEEVDEAEGEEEKEVRVQIDNQSGEEVKVEDDGDTTTVRLSGRKVLIIKDKDGTHVTVKKTETSDADKKNNDMPQQCCNKRAKVDTDWFGLDLGFNQYFTNKQIGEIGDERLALNNWKSLNVTCHFLPTTFPLSRTGVVNLKSAISLDMNNLRFSDKYNYLSGATDNALQFATSTSALTKNKLLLTYAQIPLLLNFQTNPCNKEKSVGISVGGYAGMLVGSRGKRIENGDKRFVEDKFNLNPFKYGVTFRIDYKILDFYVNYNLSSVFQTGKGPNTQIVAAGVNLLDF